MIYLPKKCVECESSYILEFVEEDVMETDGEHKPSFCPFCGETIEEDFEELLDLDQDDLDLDADE